MEIEVRNVTENATDEEVLSYAKYVRNLLGSKAFMDFLEGLTVTKSEFNQLTGMTLRTTYKLSERAKGILRDKETTKKS